MYGTVRVGCAGWTLPKPHAEHFPAAGTHLERYARRFSAVEINSTFYRPHRNSTWTRWATSVPDDFRFSVKVAREITHRQRLQEVELLKDFLTGPSHLGPKLGPLLVQLPPSLGFDPAVAERFFAGLRRRFAGAVVCEPRHESWLRPPADKLLADFEVARVAADPALVPAAAEPGGWEGLVYYRLHGSPRTYYSSYSAEYLEALIDALEAIAGRQTTWCIFDNTAAGAATMNALTVLAGFET